MTTMTRFTAAPSPEIFNWLQSALMFNGRYPVAVEEFTDDHGYVLRAELPGRAPQDISVTVAGGNLTITAKRDQDKHDGQHSEFRYGGSSRTVSLPAGVKPTEISASYDQGILEIRVPLNQQHATPHRVAVAVQSSR